MRLTPDNDYFALVDDVLDFGTKKSNRTGIDTISFFGGAQFGWDMEFGFPILTTKKIHWKSVVHELLWFLSGSTNIKYLKDNGVRIWDEWVKPDGELGPVYGYQWRNFNGQRVDQIHSMVETIKHNPDSRRNIVSAWNPAQINEMALPPCHCFFQVNVDNGKLDLHMYQRSADLFLGVPFNIASYALLTHMLAHVTNLTPRSLIITFGDLHIYENHLEALKIQRVREPFIAPILKLNPDVKDIFSFTYSDIELTEYEFHPAIKGDVAV